MKQSNLFNQGGVTLESDLFFVPDGYIALVEIFNLPFGASDTVRFDVATLGESRMTPSTLCTPGQPILPPVSGRREWSFCGCTPTIRAQVTALFLPGGQHYFAKYAGSNRANVFVRSTLKVARALSTAELGCCGQETVATLAPVISSACPGRACVGTAFSYTPTASNSPIGWAILGTIPAGTTFNTTTGVISGTPSGTAGDTHNFSLYALNAYGGSAPLQCTLTVNASIAGVTGCPGALIQGVPGSYSWTLPAYAGTVTSTATGLPTGVSVAGSTLTWNGTTPNGSYAISVTMTNGCSTVTRACTLAVANS